MQMECYKCLECKSYVRNKKNHECYEQYEDFVSALETKYNKLIDKFKDKICKKEFPKVERLRFKCLEKVIIDKDKYNSLFKIELQIEELERYKKMIKDKV